MDTLSLQVRSTYSPHAVSHLGNKCNISSIGVGCKSTRSCMLLALPGFPPCASNFRLTPAPKPPVLRLANDLDEQLTWTKLIGHCR